MSDSYIVYKHTSPSNKVYIGITYQNPERRWREGKAYKYNKHFTNAINKYGWDNFQHEILYTNLTKEEAEQKEIELIAYYDSTNQDKGYNLDRGGNSVGKHSEESKKKMSEHKRGKYIGEKNPFYGKVHTDEVKTIISEKAKERLKDKRNHPCYGKPMAESIKKKLLEINKGKCLSEETKKKISAANVGELNSMYGKTHTEEARKKISEARKIKVWQYSKDGEFINEWDSATDVELELGIRHSKISECCKNKVRTAGGYIWRYKGDYLDLNKLPWYNEGHKKVPVCQYSRNGELIKEWDSMKNASLELNIDISCICSCCNNNIKTAGGYIWTYKGNELTQEHLDWCNEDNRGKFKTKKEKV